MRLASIYRYPVKGLSPERLDRAMLSPGGMLPADRAYAIEQFAGSFDPDAPQPLSKQKFLMLMRDEKLAALQTLYDDATHQLTIARGGKRVASGVLTAPLGRQMIEQFFAAYLGGGIRPRVVAAAGHHFSDVPEKCLSLINLASVEDVGRVMGVSLDPIRFRGNLHIEGAPPWAEKAWARGQQLSIGEARFSVFKPIVRCAAVNVNPATAERDAQIPHLLERSFGANQMGVYLTALNDTAIQPGDTLTLH